MKRVLVVDDNKTILMRVRIELEKYDWIEPIYAQSYKEAMRIIRGNHNNIQAAILDYNLPDAQTGQVIELANAHDIQAVILTGTLDEHVQDLVLKNSVTNFVLKNQGDSIASAVTSVIKILNNYDCTALIVDDSEMYRKAFKESLGRMHIKSLEAKDGEEALDIIKEKGDEISFVITDYEMPKMDGLALTLAIRELYSKAELSIIAVSSSEKEDITNKFLKFGANDFIYKPFTRSELSTTVNSNLETLDLFKQVRDMANKDFLTGAYNRRYFFDSGTAICLKAKRKNAPLAVVMLDIDKFKNINDTYGHDVGDMAIREIKRVLDENLRASDLMARFGGEEFCILLEDITLEDTQALFEKIRKCFEENVIDIGETSISYTVSLGIEYGMADSLEEMVRLSDEALYYAKENGRNQVKINTTK